MFFVLFADHENIGKDLKFMGLQFLVKSYDRLFVCHYAIEIGIVKGAFLLRL